MKRPCSHMNGMTLIELILFIVIVSVGLAGVLAAFSYVKNSADPMVRKQVILVAEATMNEIMGKNFQNDPNDPSNTSSTLGCTPSTPITCRPNTPADRANYNDVSDYNGYSQTGINQIDGVTPVARLASYTLSITVTPVAFGSINASNAKQITVVVSSGNQSFTLIGYRTYYDL
jgi:MSHA pilin protein MshD